MPQINIESLTVGEVAANCYLVENAETHECFVVDPGAEGRRIISRIADRKPVAVLLTHAHFDHIGAADDLCRHYGIPLYVHQADASKLSDPMGNVSGLFGMPMTVTANPAVLLKGGETLTLAGMEAEVLHTPGHSAGSVCYLLREEPCVITGDTLFANGYGRTDFPDGSFTQLRQSLRLLFSLTPRMIAYPGHDIPGFAGRDASEEA